MKIAITLLLYVIAFLWGWTKLRGPGRKLHRLWFGCILGYCAYINICGITETPHFSLGIFYTAFFQPVGRAIIYWLGG
ncbi:hypothetical protein MKZ24_32040 [Paenibacillus sp. FSL R7-0297]|uniref:hypothetical protein n=1 Tax=unclassified Paenibacillus TaxID=185978 RepID=UPI0004F76AEC|nr:hypothetical protein [Paenibacillus sp. FSL R5-0912]AIQ39589.1 hypothetical protein R50912_05700 [Paenibacillus sp. FSL R5-0912]